MQPNQQPFAFDPSGRLIIPGIVGPNSSWSINQQGDAVFQNVNVQTLTLMGQDVTTMIQTMALGTIAVVALPNSTAAYNGTYGQAPQFFEIVIPKFDHTRQYEICVVGKFDPNGTAPGYVAFDCFYALDRSPTMTDSFMFSYELGGRSTSTTSDISSQSVTFNLGAVNDGHDLHIGGFVYAAIAGTLYRGTQYGMVWVKDVGAATIATTYTPGTPPVQQYTRTYPATFSASYQQGGSNRGVGECYQGYYSSTNGNQWSVIGFNAAQIQSDLTGATIVSIKLFLHNKFWYYNNGGTVVVGYSSINTGNGNQNYSNVTANQTQKSFGYGEGKWFSISGTIATAFQNGTAKSIALGQGPSTSQTYYGYFEGYNDGSQPPQLQITYNK